MSNLTFKVFMKQIQISINDGDLTSEQLAGILKKLGLKTMHEVTKNPIYIPMILEHIAKLQPPKPQEQISVVKETTLVKKSRKSKS